MTKLIKAELFRLVREKSFFVILGIAAGYALLTVLLLAAVEYAYTPDELYSLGVTLPANAGEAVISGASLGNAGIFIAIAVALFNGGDFKENTVRNKITAGHTRNKIYLSSLIVSMLISAAVFAALSLVTLLLGMIFYGTDFSSVFAAEFFLSLIVCLALGCITVFFSFITKKASITIIIGVSLCIAAVYISDIITAYYLNALLEHYLSAYNNHALLEWLTRINLFSMNGMITFIPVLNQYLDSSIMKGYDAFIAGWYVNIAVTGVVWGGLFTGGGLLLFRRSEIR